MRDRWMNVGYEEEELKPYIEPQPDYKDPRRTGRHGNPLKNDGCIPFFSHTLMYLSTDVFFPPHTHILKRIMDLQETQHSNYILVLGIQTLCCRWDSPRRRSRTRWWIRSTMMWWLHICYWTIGTLRYTVLTTSFSAVPCLLLLVFQTWCAWVERNWTFFFGSHNIQFAVIFEFQCLCSKQLM